MTVPTPDDSKYYPVKLNDKVTVQSKRPTMEQVVVLTKTGQAVNRDPEGRAIHGMDLIFRIFEQLLLPEDVDTVDVGLITGDVKLGDLQNLVTAGEGADGDKPVPAKRVRRAR